MVRLLGNRMFQALRTLAQRFTPPKAHPKRLDVTDDGVALFENGREIYRFVWKDVSKIETYKRDLGNVDMICLDFTVATNETVYMTDDEMDGFNDVSVRLAHYFPSIAADWWTGVAFPAFATKHKVLFEKDVP